MSIGGLASGDFRLGQGALRILYSLVKDTIPNLTGDAFTQANPYNAANPSTTIPVNVKNGVLGGSVAFTRPDVAGGNYVGGPNAVIGARGVAGTRPLGLFINDALGNAFENTPGVASNKGPFLRGGAVGVKLYETLVQTTVVNAPLAVPGVRGTALVYAEGDRLYASVNGLLTNRWEDSLEAMWINTGALGSGAAGVCQEPDVTCMGVVLSPYDATLAELFVELYF